MPVGSEPRPGSEIAGYRLEQLLARGGMGAVYRAEGVRLGRKVALKLLAPGTYTTFPVCEGPSGIALGEGAVWVACGDGTVARLDPRTELVDMIELGQPPSGIVADFGQVRTSPGEPVE